jgi:hypothetical protein
MALDGQFTFSGGITGAPYVVVPMDKKRKLQFGKCSQLGSILNQFQANPRSMMNPSSSQRRVHMFHWIDATTCTTFHRSQHSDSSMFHDSEPWRTSRSISGSSQIYRQSNDLGTRRRDFGNMHGKRRPPVYARFKMVGIIGGSLSHLVRNRFPLRPHQGDA